MSNIVGLVRVQDSAEDIKISIAEVLNLIDFKLNNSVKNVVIKPNLCYYWEAATGYTTDPRIVAEIIDYLREKCGNDVDIKIAEADASAMRTKYAFPILGYKSLAEEKNVELCNLSKDTLIKRTVQVNQHEVSFNVPQILMQSDLIINVPKLKIMKLTKITCAMKNLFGCIGDRRKIVYHENINEAIVGINKIIHPHLTIVDGLVALGRNPYKLGLIMAGTDPFSVDWIASQIMGYNPLKIDFLKIAQKENLGNPEDIITTGVDINEFKNSFPKANFILSNYLWGFLFWFLKVYKKIVGDIVPPILEEG